MCDRINNVLTTDPEWLSKELTL